MHILKKYIEAVYTSLSIHFRWCPGSFYLFTIFVVMADFKMFRSVSVKPFSVFIQLQIYVLTWK